MKISGNCYRPGWVCPHLHGPRYHAGYTGKSGMEASHICKLSALEVSVMKSCKLAGGPTPDQADKATAPTEVPASNMELTNLRFTLGL